MKKPQYRRLRARIGQALVVSVSLSLGCRAIALGAESDFYNEVRVGTITDPRISELSGMVPVTDAPGVFWVHNDSSDIPRIFAVRQTGQILAEVQVLDAQATDWEDISLGPGPVDGLVYLYIADTGNNDRSRQTLSIYRIPEPELPTLEAGQLLSSEPAERFLVRYPDGNFDAEALVVHPVSGDIYILSKLSGPSGIYRLPHPEPGSAEQTLARIGTVDFGGLVTAADISRDGTRILVRTYAQVLELSLLVGQPFEEIFFRPPLVLPSSAAEPKSESICFDHGNRSYLTTNEGNPAPIDKFYSKMPQASCEFHHAAGSSLLFVRGDVVAAKDPETIDLDVGDALGVLEAVRGELEPLCRDRADVDDDGSLDVADVSALLDALARGRMPPKPFPTLAADPTTDSLPCGESDTKRLVEEDAPWRYWFAETSPPDGWQELSADVSDWPEGPGGVGFGPASLRTLPPGGPGISTTLWARTELDVENPGALDHLVLELDYNDGFVAYVNGVEAARANVGISGFKLPGDFPASFHPGGTLQDIFLCTEALRAGRNILALEVHNRSILDRTLFFRAAVRAFALHAPPPPPPEPTGSAAARLHLSAGTAPGIGETGVIHVRLTSETPTRGLSLFLRYEAPRIRVTGVSAAESLAGKVYERSLVNSFSGELSYAMVVDPEAIAGGALPPGEDIAVLRLEYSSVAPAGGETRLSFAARGGTIPLRSAIAVDGPRLVLPETEDLVLTLGGLELPVLEQFFDNAGSPGQRFLVSGRNLEDPSLTVKVCDAPAEFRLLADQRTLRITAPSCRTLGPAPLEVCNAGGCVLVPAGFTYREPAALWIRGDANGDSVVDISDPIAILGDLFNGVRSSPACPVALDGNADGRVDLSDAVFLLGFLFQGGLEISPPFPEPAACP